jgi:hypothetical protein
MDLRVASVISKLTGLRVLLWTIEALCLTCPAAYTSEPQFHQVASSQPAVDRKIEEREFAGPMSDPDRRYMLWVERTLSTDDVAFVPCGKADTDGWQVCSRPGGSFDLPRPPRLQHNADGRNYPTRRAAVRLRRAEDALRR